MGSLRKCRVNPYRRTPQQKNETSLRNRHTCGRRGCGVRSLLCLVGRSTQLFCSRFICFLSLGVVCCGGLVPKRRVVSCVIYGTFTSYIYAREAVSLSYLEIATDDDDIYLGYNRSCWVIDKRPLNLALDLSLRKYNPHTPFWSTHTSPLFVIYWCRFTACSLCPTTDPWDDGSRF